MSMFSEREKTLILKTDMFDLLCKTKYSVQSPGLAAKWDEVMSIIMTLWIETYREIEKEREG